MNILKMGTKISYFLIIFFLGLILCRVLCKLDMGLEFTKINVVYYWVSGVIALILILTSFKSNKSSDL
jgi:hypothetical protein